jgi:hypothetical protein
LDDVSEEIALLTAEIGAASKALHQVTKRVPKHTKQALKALERAARDKGCHAAAHVASVEAQGIYDLLEAPATRLEKAASRILEAPRQPDESAWAYMRRVIALASDSHQVTMTIARRLVVERASKP